MPRAMHCVNMCKRVLHTRVQVCACVSARKANTENAAGDAYCHARLRREVAA